MLTRREMLKAMTAALASTSSLAGSAAYASSSRPSRSARYVLQIVLQGGVDSVYTTDPKERSEIDSDVDLPYSPKEILTIGSSRFGPHFAPLAKWVPQMTIVNGVAVGVANHPAGIRQLLRLRLGATDDMPAALEVIGNRRDGQALPCVAMDGMLDASLRSAMSTSVFTALDTATPDELRMMARVSRTRGKDVRVVSGATATRANIENCAELFERLATTPRFQATPAAKANARLESLERIAWLFEHDLTRCAIVGLEDWDSHNLNKKFQTSVSASNFGMIAQLFEKLESTSNKHGPLLSNTLVVMGSELGRFPVLNPREGKDHFPEVPIILLNAGNGGKVFGQTGRRMQAVAGPNGKPVNLSDIGTTVLRLAGAEPETCGYNGRTLEYLGVG